MNGINKEIVKGKIIELAGIINVDSSTMPATPPTEGLVNSLLLEGKMATFIRLCGLFPKFNKNTLVVLKANLSMVEAINLKGLAAFENDTTLSDLMSVCDIRENTLDILKGDYPSDEEVDSLLTNIDKVLDRIKAI